MNRQDSQFETTQWSEVLLAGNQGQAGAVDALNGLCCKYWFPVYAHLRRKGNSHADAEDLTQAFFTDLLRSDKLKVADQNRGRFRSFLLTTCNNFVCNVHRSNQSQRRGGGKVFFSMGLNMDEALRRYEASDSENWTPDQLFDRRWALELIDFARQRLCEDYRKRGQAEWFEALFPFIAPSGGQPSHSEVADRLGVSVGSVKTAVHRLRKRFGVALQEEVAETVEDRDSIKDELNILLDALSGR